MPLELKTIHETIRGLQIEGRCVEELEAILIHSDDLRELLQYIHDNHNGMSPMIGGFSHESGEVKKGLVQYFLNMLIEKTHRVN